MLGYIKTNQCRRMMPLFIWSDLWNPSPIVKSQCLKWDRKTEEGSSGDLRYHCKDTIRTKEKLAPPITTGLNFSMEMSLLNFSPYTSLITPNKYFILHIASTCYHQLIANISNLRHSLFHPCCWNRAGILPWQLHYICPLRN